MHIPDGWIDPAILIITWFFTLLGLFVSIRRMKHVDERRITYMAVLAGTIFAAQMLNFPVFGGTSGHLLGAALATTIVGPWGGLLVISVVLIIQAILFGDGGILALGANIFNMGIIGVFLAYFIIRLMMVYTDPKQSSRMKIKYYSGVFLASFLSVFIASFFAAIEIGIPIFNSSSFVTFSEVLPLMLFYHLIIGVAEGVITCVIVAYFNTIEMDVFLEVNNPSFSFPLLRR